MTKKTPLDVPQTGDTWVFILRRLRVWITPEDAPPYRPYLQAAFNLSQGIFQGSQISKQSTPKEVQKNLFKFMVQPEKGLHVDPSRPLRIFFQDQDLMKTLASALQEIGVQAKFRSDVPEVDEMIRSLEQNMHDDAPELPGLLSQKGVNLHMARRLHAAAAEFYRAAPWVQLSNRVVLALQLEKQKEPWFVTVMGQGGVEYGLALYKNPAAVVRQHATSEHPLDAMPPEGMHAFFFNDITMVPFDDLEALEKYGWELADPQAYPVPMTFTPGGDVRRPSRDELLWYEAALWAIPIFIRQHLELDDSGSPLPVEASIPVTTAAGKVKMRIRYTESDQPVDTSPPFEPMLLDDLEEGPSQMPFDRRAMEGDLMRFTAGMGESALDEKTARAQELMYEAWEESSPAKRIAMARKALKISPDCADAYVLLAEDEAGDVNSALKLYEQGAAAGQRALGEAYFEENRGHFWGLLETRPFMRSLEGQAACLWQLKRKGEALQIYRQMLNLNPNDNQGIRYILADLLLSRSSYDELETLLEAYENDWSTVWKYSQALLAFHQHGPSAEADQALQEALEQNPHAPDYLLGKKRVPNRIPESISPGEDSEAANYAAHHLNYWRRLPGALDWLAKAPQPKTKSHPERITSKPAKHRFNIGDTVVVKTGVVDPQTGLNLSGRRGEVVDLDMSEIGPVAEVEWDSQTLRTISNKEIKALSEEDFGWDGMVMQEKDLKHAKPRDTPEERQAAWAQREAEFLAGYYSEHGATIRSVLEGVDLFDDAAAIQAWDAYLRQHLPAPFDAIVGLPYKDLEEDDKVSVVSYESPDEDDGVIVKIARGKDQFSLPLCNLDIDADGSPEENLLNAYLDWYDGF